MQEEILGLQFLFDCIDSLDENARGDTRPAHKALAKRRKKLWEETGGQPNASVRCPTASEQRRCRSRQRREYVMKVEEEQEVRRALDEVSALDDAVWAAEETKRANKAATRMSKDVPFDVRADYHHQNRK